jgi:hypothetical protein
LEDVKTKWIVEDLESILQEIVENVILKEVFENEERLVHEVFIHKFAREFPNFLKAHQIRKLVFSKIVDKMFIGTKKSEDGSGGQLQIEEENKKN